MGKTRRELTFKVQDDAEMKLGQMTKPGLSAASSFRRSEREWRIYRLLGAAARQWREQGFLWLIANHLDLHVSM